MPSAPNSTAKLLRITAEHLPALHGGYSTRAASAQRGYLRSQRSLLQLLIVASAIPVAGRLAATIVDTRYAAKVDLYAGTSGLVIFVVSLVLSQRQQQQAKPEIWYDARALAESTKSMAWKFMMGAEPYLGPDAEIVFRTGLLKLMQDARQKVAIAGSDADQITAEMRSVRLMKLASRVALYRADRIDSQRQWYTRRSEEHSASNRFWQQLVTVTLMVAAATNALSLIFTSLGAARGIASAIVPSAIAWNQTHRHRELAHSYAFTSHEIGILAAEADPSTDEEMARFVADCEAAFSREHTMWRARRENAEI